MAEGPPPDAGAGVASQAPAAIELAAIEPAAQMAALAAGRALCDRSSGSLVALAGADRVRFLQGLVSCDVRGLQPGQAAYGFLTSAQGKVLADVTVLATEEELLLDLPPGEGEAIAAHLARYVIADRVEIERRPEAACLALVGEAARAVAGVPQPAEGEHLRVEVEGLELRAERRSWWGLDALLLWGQAAQAPALARRLLAAGEPAGLAAVAPAAVEASRVARGVPRFGADFGPHTLPQETGLEARAVSYTKGCYLGQEVVARLHYRGQANRLLVTATPASGSPPPPADTSLELDGRPVGEVTSAAGPPWLAEWHHLALVHRRGATPGTLLAWPGGEVLVGEPAFG